MSSSILIDLMAVIDARRDHPPEGRSYVVSLMRGGVSAIGSKVTEEAGELVEAAHEADAEGHVHLVHEAADLIFHTLVLLSHRGVAWQEVEAELARRFGTSGHDEKESRTRA